MDHEVPNLRLDDAGRWGLLEMRRLGSRDLGDTFGLQCGVLLFFCFLSAFWLLQSEDLCFSVPASYCSNELRVSYSSSKKDLTVFREVPVCYIVH